MTVVPTPTHVLTRRVANRNRPQLEDGAGHRAHMGRSSEEARRLSLRSLPNHGWDRRPSNDCPSMTLAINGTVATWVAARWSRPAPAVKAKTLLRAVSAF